MKKFSKLLTKCIALVMVVATLFCTTACGNGGGGGMFGGGGDNEQTLEIYLLYKGYQDEWLTAMVDEFKKTDWVNEKYPELVVKVEPTEIDTDPHTKIKGGISLNTYDLVFGNNTLKGYEGTEYVADLTDTVYLTDLPDNPGVKVMDKIKDQALLSLSAKGKNIVERDDGVPSYYAVGTIHGCTGLLYNNDLLKTLGKELPRTTMEFRDLCAFTEQKGYTYTLNGQTIKSNCAIMVSNECGYWAYAYPHWWAQYEGLENYYNFYKGIHDGERSARVIQQYGRLRSWEELEMIFRSGYGYDYATSVDYIVAQTNFLGGNGLFHYNGDYFTSEMSLTVEALKTQGIEKDIRYMKMPVISSIVEKLDLYTHKGTEYTALTKEQQQAYDVKLSAIIADIDNDLLYAGSPSEAAGVSKKDFEKVAEARQMSLASSGSGQMAVVPSYAKGKQVAFDFLRFMHTDKAVTAGAIASGGIIMPVKYDFVADTETYNKLSAANKSKIALFEGTANYPFLAQQGPESFPLGAAGLTGIAAATLGSGSYEGIFSLTEGQLTTARMLYDKEIAYWNDTTWGQLLARAGLSA